MTCMNQGQVVRKPVDVNWLEIEVLINLTYCKVTVYGIKIFTNPGLA